MKKSYVTVTDQFCGAGGSSVGVTKAGAELVLALNHWELAIKTHNTNFPNAIHECTDISACDPRRYPSTDVLVTSPECFPEGALVLTSAGLKPIESVSIGDLVLTHLNRWRAVTSVMKKVSDTVVVKGQGHPGIETTSEHPFYVREQSRLWDNEKRDYNRRIISEPQWVKAFELTDAKYRWATPLSVGHTNIPPVGGRGAEFTTDFWWMIGRWLGDGTLRIRHDKKEDRQPKRAKRPFRPFPANCEYCNDPAPRHETYKHLALFYCSKKCSDLSAVKGKCGSSVQICCGYSEVDELLPRLNAAIPVGSRAKRGEYRWSRRNLRTAVLFDCPHNGLTEWLFENFGQHAHGKKLPAWALSMPSDWKQSLLDGYVSADGSVNVRSTAICTVSKALAVGIRMLAESLGYRSSMHCYDQSRSNNIEGRIVNVRDIWVVKWENNKSEREAFSDGQHAWSLVKSIQPGRSNIDVYNLSVDEDESYTVDGIVVHNCTNHSLAKGVKRKGQAQPDLFGEYKIDPAEERSRATMWDVPRFAERHNYNLIIVENVVDARNWRLFDAWLHAMKLLDYEHKCVYYNSMHAHPTPQSRDRMYVIFWKKNNRAPNLDFRPPAHCHRCERDVNAVQAWKKPTKPFGKYRQQYVYCCPVCASIVEPYYYCAANAIDWSLPCPRIGDRTRPLTEKTIQRIEAGLRKYGGKATTVNLEHGHSKTAPVYAVDEVMRTQTTRQSVGLCVPPYIVNFRNNQDLSPIDTPLSTLCTSGSHHGLLMPPFITSYYGTGGESGIDEVIPTVTTLDRHGVVVPPAWIMANYSPGWMKPATSTIGTITTADHHSLVTPPFILGYYTRPSGVGAALSGVDDAMPTQSTRPLHYLAMPAETPSVEDCGFRMLQPHEIQAAMAFPSDYVVTGTQRDKVKQLGNAVTPPVMEMIFRRCVETLM